MLLRDDLKIICNKLLEAIAELDEVQKQCDFTTYPSQYQKALERNTLDTEDLRTGLQQMIYQHRYQTLRIHIAKLLQEIQTLELSI